MPPEQAIFYNGLKFIGEMAAQEARDFYYDKGREDYMKSVYDQPFPNPMLLELDDFEMLCNKAYNKGYHDEREGKSYEAPSTL